MISGGCECGAIRYRSAADARPPVACHCSQCRRISGHFWAATQVPTESLRIEGLDHLIWYRSSAIARRGFCGRCGSSLFWERDGEGATSVGAGTLDKPTGLWLTEHIFTEDKGDYYDLPDHLPVSAKFEK